MARKATIIGHAVDAWGDAWDVRESRATAFGFDVLLGWPADQPRGRGGSGGPKVIVTNELLTHLTQHRMTPSMVGLPIGNTAITRLRRLLGHHRQLDAASWWQDRVVDLADMTVEQFSKKHGRSAGAISVARAALLGTQQRPAGWWRAPDVASMLLADRPRAAIADDLGVTVNAVRRMRSLLRKGGVLPAPSSEPTRSTRRRLTTDQLAEATRLIEGGASTSTVAALLGVTAAAIQERISKGDLPRTQWQRRRDARND